jgi:putative acetyltransferase
MPNILIAHETPDQPDVRAFFAASEAYMGALYPAESNHFVDAAALVAPHVAFLIARRDGRAVGCGAVVCGEGRAGQKFGEIKRMWVDPGQRGGGIGVALLDALVAAARVRGLSVLRLETGISQPEAIGLYRRAGFVECGPFGGYQPDPLSLFMELDLINTSAA